MAKLSIYKYVRGDNGWRYCKAAFYGTYVYSSRSGSIGVEKSLEPYKRTRS